MGNYYLYKLGEFLARALPIGLSRWLVCRLCDLHFVFSKADRRAVLNNLKALEKTDQVPAVEVREVFQNFGRYLLDFFTMKRYLTREFIADHVKIDHVEYLEQVMQQGRGGIIVSAHLGNWELGGTVLPMMGYPLSVVALAHKDPRVNALFNAQRETFGAQVIQTDAAVRRIIEHLKQKRLVAILADRDFGNNGIIMDFLGRQTMLPKGAAFFSIKTGAPIIPMFFLRKDYQQFEVHVHKAIDPPVVHDGKITDEIIREYTRRYLTAIENEIKANPTQWLLFREYWQS